MPNLREMGRRRIDIGNYLGSISFKNNFTKAQLVLAKQHCAPLKQLWKSTTFYLIKYGVSSKQKKKVGHTIVKIKPKVYMKTYRAK
jgi:hypothetical protein